MKISLKAGKKARKTLQMVWLEFPVMSKVLELAEQYDLAPNVVIAEIVKKALLDYSDVFEPKPAEPKVVMKTYCPFCLQSFPDLAALEKHWEEAHPEIAKLAKEKVALK